MNAKKTAWVAGLLATTGLGGIGVVQAQDGRVGTFNTYGAPGLVDMPSAEQLPDATLSFSLAVLGDSRRSTLGFQITPRLSGSFRYSAFDNFDSPASVDGTYYDRSFDLRYQLVEESARIPGVVIGLQDFIGTGLYGAEYIVATKTLGQLQVTGGLGWGRLGSANSLGSTGSRPAELLGSGGIPTYDRWFRGPFAAFGGVAWTPRQNLTLKAEYSSDGYVEEARSAEFERKSPWNFGVDYHLKNGAQLSAYYAYGTEVGAQITLVTNPKKAGVPGGLEPAGVPVLVRSRADIADLGWTEQAGKPASIRKTMSRALAKEGLSYEGLTLEPRRAILRIRNGTYQREPQAIGRAVRVMTRVLPASVEELTVVPVVDGMGISAVT